MISFLEIFSKGYEYKTKFRLSRDSIVDYIFIKEIIMDKVLKILEEIRPEFDFRNSNNFIQNGCLDSLDIISLVSILDESFRISINGTDIVPENFEDIESINKLILKCGGIL